jgi:excisionase family DNA binding protein
MLNAMRNLTRWLLVVEAARIARTAESTVRYWCAVGKLPSVRPGRRRLISEEALERFLSGMPAKPEIDDVPQPLPGEGAAGVA